MLSKRFSHELNIQDASELRALFFILLNFIAIFNTKMPLFYTQSIYKFVVWGPAFHLLFELQQNALAWSLKLATNKMANKFLSMKRSARNSEAPCILYLTLTTLDKIKPWNKPKIIQIWKMENTNNELLPKLYNELCKYQLD